MSPLNRFLDLLPEPMRSIRFRIAMTFSIALFLVGALLLTAINLTLQTALASDTVAREASYRHPGRGFYRQLNQEELPDYRRFETTVNKHALNVLEQYSFAALGVLAVASFGVGWFASGRVLRPIGRIAEAARRMEATDLSRRIDLRGPRDELRALADTFDALLARLETTFQRERQFVADASHELRNPLAIVRANLENLEQGTGDDPDEFARQLAALHRATDRMARVVDDLMLVARAQAPAAEYSNVELTRLLGEARDEFAPLAAARGVSVQVAASPGLTVRADRLALGRGLANLVDNALRYAPHGSTIRLVAGPTSGWAWIAVADGGPGIAVEDGERVFTRRWRRSGDAANGDGSGLGLAIVRQIAEAHGGRARVYSSPGEGAVFVIWLPLGGAAGRSASLPTPAFERSPLT
ncbi:MAG: HAMP domain-containing histidine kinase [Chloroflexota bacterium]|nr:HAMP domain-containing histidine kinase [Chloroflexota bacterium]